MAVKKGTIQARGDFGNPSGSGLARMMIFDLGANADTVDILARLQAFGAGLVTDGFTECNIGDVSVVAKTNAFVGKPGNNVNVDDKLEVTFRTILDDSIRDFTISGMPSASPLLEEADGGRRLTDAGKVALQDRMNTLLELTPPANGVIVLYGKHITKY